MSHRAVIFPHGNTSLHMRFLIFVAVGNLFILQGRIDRSLVEFDRQFSLAAEISDEAETAEAYLGIGSGYLSKGEIEEAVRYLDTSLNKYILLGNVHKQCVALKALQSAYFRKNEVEISNSYALQVKTIEGELEHKFATLHVQLDGMKQRLELSSSANVDKVIIMERETVYAHRIKLKIGELQGSKPFIIEEQEKHQIRLSNQHKLLADIDDEIAAAAASTATQMKTKLLLEQGEEMMVDVEELKSRLQVRKVIELDELERLNGLTQRLHASLINVDDTMKTLLEDLEVEECALMKCANKNRNFRCIAVDKANAAGDHVLGRNSGGVETVIASEGGNIHLMELKSGKLLHVFTGDVEDRMVGERTKGSNGTAKQLGHYKTITCLVYDQEMIFSGYKWPQ